MCRQSLQRLTDGTLIVSEDEEEDGGFFCDGMMI